MTGARDLGSVINTAFSVLGEDLFAHYALMRLGSAFPSFSFTLLEIDPRLGGDWLFAFHELFRECASAVFTKGAAKT